MMHTRRFLPNSLGMLVAAALAAVAYVQAHQTNNRGARIPAGFAQLGDAFWKGPWIYSSGTQRAAITGLHLRMGAASGAAMPIRLDDGSTGRLRVTAGPCTTLDECGPGECACSATDSFWIDVTDSRGRRAAQVHLSAAYGEFDVIPVDLVDGPGDELVIIRLNLRAAPPPAPDLQIWKVGATKPIDLIQRKGEDDLFFLGGRLQTVEGAIPCAQWRTRLSVNLNAPKPRPIARLAEFAASDWPDTGCHLSGEGAREMTAVKRHPLLAFEKGAYRLR